MNSGACFHGTEQWRGFFVEKTNCFCVFLIPTVIRRQFSFSFCVYV